MPRTTDAIDITDLPELRRLVEEVRAGNEPRVLRAGDEDVAVLTPLPLSPAPGPDATPSDDEIFLSSFGGWQGIVDGEKLKRELEEARGSDRPLVVLDQ